VRLSDIQDVVAVVAAGIAVLVGVIFAVVDTVIVLLQEDSMTGCHYHTFALVDSDTRTAAAAADRFPPALVPGGHACLGSLDAPSPALGVPGVFSRNIGHSDYPRTQSELGYKKCLTSVSRPVYHTMSFASYRSIDGR
jgi:hypothetical protein